MEDEEINQRQAKSSNATSAIEVKDNPSTSIDVIHTPHSERENVQHQDQHVYNVHQDQIVGSPMRMGELAAMLPDYGPHGHQRLQHPQHAQPSGINATVVYPYQAAQLTRPNQLGFSPAFVQQMPMQMYQGHGPYSHYSAHPGVASAAPHFTNQMMYPQGMMHNAVQTQYPQFQHFQSGQVLSQMAAGGYERGSIQYPQPQGYSADSEVSQFLQTEQYNVSTTHSQLPARTPNALRGPPRKPKQSGHALWVGNLPPGTSIIDLKDHFSRDATDDIESVFLISKSNCAFVNYKSEKSCASAMTRFHDSRFQGVRLVCRLRRGSAPGSSLAPDSSLDSAPNEASEDQAGRSEAQPDPAHPKSETEEEQEQDTEKSKVKERFFIIKSLTTDDLERSASSGVWATQSHNEAALNNAFKSAENVYLIFSANKSGEYFGYARMESPIDEKSATTLDASFLGTSVHESQPTSDSDLPLTIPTPATATAPKGHIIDDSARGTIFWEAEHLVTETLLPSTELNAGSTEADLISDDEDVPDSSPGSPSKTSQAPISSNTFGRPFRISWQSTDRLPFYRTRGLRNPWNSNREVKIARDGTELEPNVGRKLIGMFGTQPGMTPRAHQQQQSFVVGIGQNPSGATLGPGHSLNTGYNRPY